VPCGAAVAAEATAVGEELWGGLSSLRKPFNPITFANQCIPQNPSLNKPTKTLYRIK